MSETYLLVALGGERYALPVDNVVEVGTVTDTAPLPGAPPGVVGLQNIRGEVVPLVDLAALVGAAESSGADARVVVDDGRCRAALAVERLLDVASLERGEERAEAAPLRSSVLVDGALVGVLDMSVLLDGLSGAVEG